MSSNIGSIPTYEQFEENNRLLGEIASRKTDTTLTKANGIADDEEMFVMTDLVTSKVIRW